MDRSGRSGVRRNDSARDRSASWMSIAKAFLSNLTGSLRPAITSRRVMSLRRSHVGRIAIPTEMKVELTDVEDQICMLFDDCSKYLREEKGVTTTCRIAGGWVRDKVNYLVMCFRSPTNFCSSSYSYSAQTVMTSTSHLVR